eukprot:scaffold772_cov339-Pavlova_lutheri.AAC.89
MPPVFLHEFNFFRTGVSSSSTTMVDRKLIPMIRKRSVSNVDTRDYLGWSSNLLHWDHQKLMGKARLNFLNGYDPGLENLSRESKKYVFTLTLDRLARYPQARHRSTIDCLCVHTVNDRALEQHTFPEPPWTPGRCTTTIYIHDP